MPTVKDIRDNVIRYLLEIRPKYSDYGYLKSIDKKENAKFFNRMYACDRLIKEFSDETIQNYDLDFFLHDLEGKIEIDKMFSKQDHNKDRYLVLDDVYHEVRQII